MLNSGFLSPKRQSLLICFGLIIAVLVPYVQVGGHDFVLCDDPRYLAHARKSLNWESIQWALTATDAGFWHPLTWLSLMLDNMISGANAAGYHSTNVVFHIANTILLFLLLNRVTKESWESAFVAALFALHPLHVESVAWVAQRKDVLSTFFLLLTIRAYVYYAEKPGLYRYLLVNVFFMLGLMSKPMVATLPFLLLLFDYWPLKRFPARYSSNQPGQLPGTEEIPLRKETFPDREGEQYPRGSISRLIAEKVPLFAVAAVVIALTFYTEGKIGALKPLNMYPLEVRSANALVSYAVYLWKTVYPINMAFFYPHRGMPPWWEISLSFAFLVSVTALVIYRIKRYPFLVVGWLWYLASLVPVIGLIQIGNHALADRYTYVPLIGIFIMVAWGVSGIFKRWPHAKAASYISSGSFIIFLLLLAWFQAGVWKNSETLFRHAINTTERNYIAHNNLGLYLFNIGSTEEAVFHLSEAIRIKPDFIEPLLNLGNLMMRQNKHEAAVPLFLKAISIKPGFADSHLGAAEAYFFMGKDEAALRHYQIAVSLKPGNASAENNMAIIMMRRNNYDEAESLLKNALQHDPSLAHIHNNLGVVLSKKGKLNEAVYEFREALRIDPRQRDADINLKKIIGSRLATD